MPTEVGSAGSPGAGVTGTPELPNISAGNPAWVPLREREELLTPEPSLFHSDNYKPKNTAAGTPADLSN